MRGTAIPAPQGSFIPNALIILLEKLMRCKGGYDYV
jgi:hypothetical protein